MGLDVLEPCRTDADVAIGHSRKINIILTIEAIKNRAGAPLPVSKISESVVSPLLENLFACTCIRNLCGCISMCRCVFIVSRTRQRVLSVSLQLWHGLGHNFRKLYNSPYISNVVL